MSEEFYVSGEWYLVPTDNQQGANALQCVYATSGEVVFMKCGLNGLVTEMCYSRPIERWCRRLDPAEYEQYDVKTVPAR